MCDAVNLGCGAPAISEGYFAFARVKEDVCLVQGMNINCYLCLKHLLILIVKVSLATPASALTTVDAKIFRHEFITIFRLLETKTFHPSDISIIEHINDYHVRYEEENETVFLARELMDHLRKMTEKPRIPRTQIGRYGTQFVQRSLRS